MRLASALTDLDGTLLERGGVLGSEARNAIDDLKRRGIPVVPLTSKTEVELRVLLAELDLGSIGVFENGAGVISPDGVVVSEHAIPVAELDRHLRELARLTSLSLTPVGALPTAELQRITGLAKNKIPPMLERRFDLPFLAPDEAGDELTRAVDRRPPLRLTRGGLFWHLSGNHGKEDALGLLLRAGLVKRPVAGFGDALNDAGFLGRCDIAVLIPGPSGVVDPALASALPAGLTAPFPAGRGWAEAVRRLLDGDSG